MRIINKTHFDSMDLLAIFRRAADMELEPAHRKRLKVHVGYTRGRDVSGCAYLKSNWSKIRIAKHKPTNPRMLAWLACHEFAHCRGMDHRQMPAHLRFWAGASHERYAWAEGMPIRVRPKKARLTFRSLEPTAKLVHAQRMFARSQTRLKRAQTIAKKWQAKVRYYEKKQAAPLTSAAGTT